MTASTGLLARLTSNKEQCPHCSPFERSDLNNTPELTFPPPLKWSDLNGPPRLTFPLHKPHQQQILKQRQAALKLHPHGRPPALATTATQLCLHNETGCSSCQQAQATKSQDLEASKKKGKPKWHEEKKTQCLAEEPQGTATSTSGSHPGQYLHSSVAHCETLC